MYFEPIPLEIIADWLQIKFPRLGMALAGSIAIQSNGNVRAAETVAMSIGDNWTTEPEVGLP